MPEKQKEQLISQSGVLSMGFTKSMIDKLLPPPILKRNPHYASSAPMKLWREDDVRSVMATQEFQTMAAKAAARKAASAKQEWYLEHGNVDILSPNTETLERWMVNFIRHNLCEYDDKLVDLFGLVGKEELYHRLKTETLAKIAGVYPELDVECKRQAQE